MRFIIITLAIALAAFGVQLFLPWWSMVFVAFIIGYLSKLSGWGAFGAGLLGCGAVWFIYAMVLNMANESLLASKVGPLFFIPEPLLLVAVSTFIAALVGALGAAGGRNLREVLA